MNIYIECPHCTGMIHVLKNEINCGIFRHAYFKSYYIKNDIIHGCGKPFRLFVNDDKIHIEICEYI
jgi:hypothetical protein